MDKIQALFEEYERERTRKLDNIDHSRKTDIIAALEEYAREPQVAKFLTDVAENEAEYDLARIEAFKVFQVQRFGGDQRRLVWNAIVDVLLNSRDDDVRNYAAIAAAEYCDISDVYSALIKVLENRDEESALRWNAFAAVERCGARPEGIRLMRVLQSEEEFSESADRVLREWKAE